MSGIEDLLNSQEREVFKEILRDIQKIKNASKEPKKEREIVPIKDWVEDEYYVGPPGMSLYPYWKRKLVEIFDRDREVPINEIILTGGIGCRPLGSKYETNQGYLTLDQISLLSDVKVMGPKGKFVDVIDVHYVGLKRTIKIVFDDGYQMEATVDHRVKVLEEGKVVWKRFDELTEDSKVIRMWYQSKTDFKLKVVRPVEFHLACKRCGDIEVRGHVYINEGIIQHNTGKSTMACFCMVRKLYELSCYTNIPALFSLMPGSFIYFMYFTISKTQAELTGYGQIKSIIDSIPYFQENFPRNDRLQSMMVFPENLIYLYGSNQLHSIGMNLIGSVLDEANFFQKDAQNATKSIREYSKIAEMYSSIVNRARSRFMTNKRDDSLSILVSSNTTSSSFTDKRIQEVGMDKNVIVVNARVWDVKPEGTYSSEMFWVFTGSDLFDPCIVEDVNDVYSYTDSMDLPRVEGTIDEVISAITVGRDKFVQVPTDFKKQYEDNIFVALQDISGLSVAPSGRLFSSKPLYQQACDTVYEHPFTKSEIVISTHDSVAIKDYLKPGYRPYARDKRRFIHIDQSTTNDSTGFASSYVDRYVKNENTGLWEPVIVTDILLRINPPRPPRKISISKVRDFIFYMRDVWDLEIGYVTYDSFASAESLQVLSENGIPSGNLSVDRTDDQYLNLVNLIYEGRLKTYHYRPAERELFELIHFRGARRVDHPVDGSKDVCDGWCGSVWNAMTQTKDETPKDSNYFNTASLITSDTDILTVEDFFEFEW